MSSSSQVAQRKRTALEAEFEKSDAAAVKKLQRGRKQDELEQAVAQAIRDNLRTMSSEELDGIVYQGLTCRERLRRDKQLWLAEDRKGLKMGGCYYTWLRSKYTSASNPRSQLVLAWEEVPPRLRSALAEAGAHIPKRAPLLAYVKGLTRACRGDVIALLRFLCGVNPATSLQHLQTCMTILTELQRLDVYKVYGEEMVIMRPKFDEILLQAGSSSRVVKGHCLKIFRVLRAPSCGVGSFLSREGWGWPIVVPGGGSAKFAGAGAGGGGSAMLEVVVPSPTFARSRARSLRLSGLS